MSITPTGTGRNRTTLLRQLAAQAAIHPRLVSAVTAAICDTLPSVIESLLRESHGGETVRIYSARGDVTRDEQDREARDRRIHALSTPPSSLSAVAIAAQERITPHRVRQILRRLGAKSGSVGG